METLHSAASYIERGLAPIPIPPGEKGPRLKDWPKLRIREEEVDHYFGQQPQNIGVLLGEPSGNLMDVDLDCAETVALAPHFLPGTEMVFGRDSKRASHWLYLVETLPKNKKYADPTDKSVLVELRGSGLQTVFPPSTHPSGEQITFDRNGEPTSLKVNELTCAVDRLASAALLARHWPAKGSRNEAALALGGALLRAGWCVEEASGYIEAIAVTDGDSEAKQRAATVEHTFQKQEAGQSTTGLPSLSEIIEPKVVNKLREWLGIKREAASEAIEKEIHELNARHAVIRIGGKTAILNEGTDPVLRRREITLSSPADFRTYYANRDVFDGKKSVNAAQYWLRHQKRRQYEGLVFAPGQETPGYYNLWRGFAVEPKHGNCSLYLNHIRDVIASGDDEIYEYVIAWMADAVQNPARRPGTAIVLRGKQGVGKGVFCSEFGRLFGQHFVHVQHARHLTGHFNAHLKDALIVFADEAFWAGDKAAEGALKAMVTEDVLPIEFKGKDAIYVRNHIRLLVSSNNEWVVPAGLEERRFFVLDVSEARMQDRNYFGAFIDQMNNGGREALLDFLMNYDLHGVDLGKFPKTSALQEQKLHSMTPVQKWWFDRLMDGAVCSTDSKWMNEVATHLVHEDYVNHSSAIGCSRKSTQTELGTALNKLVPGLQKKRRGSGQHRKWYYVFPDPAECRAAFDRLMGAKNPWPEDN